MNGNQRHAVKIQRISVPEEFYLLQDKWNALLNESPENNFFLRWEWLWAWWKAYEDKNDELCILLIFRGDDLIGIAPFYIVHKSWRNLFSYRRLMFLGTKEGNVISEYMDIICRDGDEEDVIRRVIEFVAQEDLCDDLFLHMIDASSKTINLLESISHNMKFLHIIADKVESPYIRLNSGYDDFLNGLSSMMRHNIRTNERRLESCNDAAFSKTDGVSEFDADFEELVRLHQCRWESRGLHGSFSKDRFREFQRMVMPYILKNGHLELRFLSVSGKKIAALYNILYNNKIYFYQSGLDAAFDRKLAAGLLLHNHSIKEAVSNGLKEYDFLPMGNLDSYKKHWTKDCRYVCNIYMARPGIVKLATAAQDKMRTAYHAMREF